MPTIWMLLRGTAVVVGGSAALLAGGIAHADPAPSVPVPNMTDQLVNAAANAPQMLQSLATALGAKPPAPATPPPLASATLPMPQLPPGGAPGAASAVPGATSMVPGANSLVPGAGSLLPGATPTAPAASPTTTGPSQLMPSAQVGLPQVPFLPPLPQQLSLPGDLASLAPRGAPHGVQPGAPAVSTPGVAPAAPSNPLLIPLSALP